MMLGTTRTLTVLAGSLIVGGVVFLTQPETSFHTVFTRIRSGSGSGSSRNAAFHTLHDVNSSNTNHSSAVPAHSSSVKHNNTALSTSITTTTTNTSAITTVPPPTTQSKPSFVDEDDVPTNMTTTTVTTTTAASSWSTTISPSLLPPLDDFVIPPQDVTMANISFAIMHRRDRSGAAIGGMLRALAYSFQHGLHFIGVCKVKVSFSQKDTPKLLQAMGIDHLFPFWKHCSKTNNDTFHLLDFNNMGGDDMATLVTPNFRKYLLSQSAFSNYTHSITTNKDREDRDDDNKVSHSHDPQRPLTVAVHIRRGDVHPCSFTRGRYLPNSHYLRIIERYVKPISSDNVNITIYGQAESYESYTPDFAPYNVVLESDFRTVWWALATADIAILSKSSFSFAPALFNPNMVIKPIPDFDVPGWTIVDDDIYNASLLDKRQIIQEECGITNDPVDAL
jgi:hypothetical protein